MLCVIIELNLLQQDEMISLRSQLNLALNENKELKDLFELVKSNEKHLQEKLNEIQGKYTKVSDFIFMPS